MTIKYAGLKPVINEHGITFKDGKEDKYKYLKYAIDILIAIDHSYESKTKYSHTLNKTRLSPDEILNELLKFHPNLEEVMQKQIDSYILHLEQEEEDVKARKTLADIEKQAFVGNLRIMRNYKIQRAKNKIFYMHCIDTIVETIIKYKIKELDTPFTERFWHILQTMQGHLSSKKISSDLKMINDGSLKAVLNINIY